MADIAHVLWAANLGCLGFHPWPYRADDPDNTDELRIDLDPSPGVTFPMVQEAAAEVRQFLGDNGITSFIKTTGNRGLHVYVRVEPGWDSFGTRQAAVSVARALAAARPDLITDKWWKEERGARVFIDFNQNAPHKTVFGAWCVRARPGAQVSTPFAWEELPGIHPDALTVQSVPGPARGRRRSVGGHRRGRRSRSPRSSSVTSATSPTAPLTRRGHRCTRRCPTKPAASTRAAPAQPSSSHPTRVFAQTRVSADGRYGRKHSGRRKHSGEGARRSIAAMSPNDPSPWQPPAVTGTPPPPPPARPSAPPPPPGSPPGVPAVGYGTPPGYPAPGYGTPPVLVGAAKPPRPASPIGGVLMIAGAVIAAVGCFLPWLTIADTTINGFDEGPDDAALGGGVIFFALVLLGHGDHHAGGQADPADRHHRHRRRGVVPARRPSPSSPTTATSPTSRSSTPSSAPAWSSSCSAHSSPSPVGSWPAPNAASGERGTVVIVATSNVA